MELYGLFMEILWKTWPNPRPLQDITGKIYGKFTDFHGYFHGKLMERWIHKIRLLGPQNI